jgi:hypothetical protein
MTGWPELSWSIVDFAEKLIERKTNPRDHGVGESPATPLWSPVITRFGHPLSIRFYSLRTEDCSALRWLS